MNDPLLEVAHASHEPGCFSVGGRVVEDRDLRLRIRPLPADHCAISRRARALPQDFTPLRNPEFLHIERLALPHGNVQASE